MELHQNHRNKIASVLLGLDEALCEFEAWAKGREVCSVFYSEKNDLSREQKVGILKETAELRKQLRNIKSVLQLQSEEKNVTSMIWSRSAGLWETVLELEENNLKGYGEISSELVVFLKPHVRLLLEKLQRITGIASRNPGQ
jgi:hypothetical protein